MSAEHTAHSVKEQSRTRRPPYCAAAPAPRDLRQRVAVVEGGEHAALGALVQALLNGGRGEGHREGHALEVRHQRGSKAQRHHHVARTQRPRHQGSRQGAALGERCSRASGCADMGGLLARVLLGKVLTAHLVGAQVRPAAHERHRLPRVLLPITLLEDGRRSNYRQRGGI